MKLIHFHLLTAVSNMLIMLRMGIITESVIAHRCGQSTKVSTLRRFTGKDIMSCNWSWLGFLCCHAPVWHTWTHPIPHTAGCIQLVVSYMNDSANMSITSATKFTIIVIFDTQPIPGRALIWWMAFVSHHLCISLQDSQRNSEYHLKLPLAEDWAQKINTSGYYLSQYRIMKAVNKNRTEHQHWIWMKMCFCEGGHEEVSLKTAQDI